MSQFLDWLSSDSKYLCASIPTGFGKSVLGMVVSHLSKGHNIAVLTSTKGLQDQLLKDFSPMGLVEIMGQNSYQCRLDKLTVDQGPCHTGWQCGEKPLCSYYTALDTAQKARLLVTNYSYWLAQTNYSSGLSELDPLTKSGVEFDLLVCDEAHLARKALDSHMQVELSSTEVLQTSMDRVHTVSKPEDWTWSEWKDAAKVGCSWATSQLAALELQLRQSDDKPTVEEARYHRHLKSLCQRLAVMQATTERWVVEDMGESGWRFSPLWPAAYSDRLLRSKRVVLMSAILSPQSVAYLGVPPDDTTWIQAPSPFPVDRTPINHISTIRVDYRTEKDDLARRQWVNRIDQIISRRQDRKGILFTVSYSRAKYFMEHTIHKGIAITHGTRNVIQQVQKFKAAKAPAILVSPSVTSGWDFPDDECRYIIVGKIPLPNTQNALTDARRKVDKDWVHFEAMETLVQEAGRGTRHVGDWCEVLVTDDNWRWWWPRYGGEKAFAPRWFGDRVGASMSTVPDPL